MIRQFLRSARALVSAARSTIEISATVTAMALAAAVVPPMTGGRHVMATRHASAGAAAFTRLSAVPSHNGIYRASLIPSSDGGGGRDTGVWVVEVRTSRGTPVDHATLAVERWIPDDERVAAIPARVTSSLGNGRYRVEGLRLDGRGWWNVRLAVAASGGTDSLAFNLVR